jgi:hypothetical protein
VCRYGQCWDESCHLDCFGGLQCEDGVIYESLSGPIPCWEQSGMFCPVTERRQCERGCRTDGVTWGRSSYDPDEDFAWLCEEGRPKEEGDPCAEDDHCAPTEPTETDAGVEDMHLQCDVDAGACVVAE